MRGFEKRAAVEAAWRWVDAHARPLASETVPLTELAGRVLAGSVAAPRDVPAFDRSAMDGYAVRADETDGAGDYNPLPLTIIGQSMPGRPCSETVTPGTAVRIMTGAALPAGADAVVPAEYATETASGDRVEITAAVPPGKHVGRVGEDIRRGDEVLSASRRLRPQDVGVLASLGMDRAEVVRRPRVRLLVTGNELVPPDRPCGPHEIYEANSWLLRGLVARDGGALDDVRQLPDDAGAIRRGLSDAAADVILVSGGSSVGAEDHAPALLAEVGELAIHGVAMRPSSPAGMGRISESPGGALVFLLPGNPVSCLCAYDFFAGRAIRLLGGRPADWPYRAVRGTLTRKVVSLIGRTDYCRVRVTGGPTPQITPLAISGASILSSTVRADGFAVIPADREGYAEGTQIEVFLYDG
jgi:molybdopterin molybdotransferase